MTPVKAAQSLIQLTKNGQVAYVNAGHQLMVEAPEETLKAMMAFCKK
jgi:pimeloyl-ACP methyl ester carboxylesterase